MPSNNSKYSPEFREQTARHIIETGKSATMTAEELGIDIGTVCRWVRAYRKKYDLPTWDEEKRRRKGNQPKEAPDLVWENKKLAKALKLKEKQLADIEEENDILKKSLAIFARPRA